MTVAAFMELALYDPECGYYARAARRSGRAGDFFTSVDVGPVFGELLEIQLAEMAVILDSTSSGAADRYPQTTDRHQSPTPNPQSPQVFDLVEAGAGNGRLSADILRAARERHPDFFDRIGLHLVETSAQARAAQPAVLGDVGDRLRSSGDALPDTFEGVLIANELLDAMPVHQVVMREDGLREIYVDVRSEAGGEMGRRPGPFGPGELRTIEDKPSTPALQEYLDRAGVRLEPGWCVEINLRAVEWIRDAARRLRRGFIVLIDYGHDARELYSVTHAAGTLTTFSGHRSRGPESIEPAWLQNPGGQDITAHVDFTSVQAAAEAEGMTTVGFLDQTYFLLGLLASDPWSGLSTERSAATALAERSAALKTLTMPGGLGSTHKVLILGKGVGKPALRGCSFSVRVT